MKTNEQGGKHSPKSGCRHPQEVPRPSLLEKPRQEKTLLERLIASMDQPQAKVEQIAAGGRFAALSAAGNVGLASVLGASPGPEELAVLEQIKSWPLQRAAGLLLDDSPFKASLGLAALNAGFAPPPPAAAVSAGEMLSGLCQGRRVVVVGDFPFAQDLRQTASSLTVLDLRPGHGSQSAPEPDAALAQCQVAAISSTTLLTRSLARLLQAAKQAFVVLVGPSTPWTPVLFDMGADVLAGSVVANPKAVLEAVAKDLPFYEIKRRGVRLAIWQKPGPDLAKRTN